MLLSENCLMEEFTQQDVKNAVKIYTNRQTRKFLGGALPRYEAEKKAADLLNKKTSDEKVFAVKTRAEKDFIGLIYFAPYYDTGYYEISYEFLPEFWGKGYAFEIMTAFLTAYHQCTGVQKRIYAETQTENIRSRKLLEKLGYIVESELIRYGAKQTVYYIDMI